MAALAGLLHGCHGLGHLLRVFNTFTGDGYQIGHRTAVLINGALEIIWMNPDLWTGGVALRRVTRLGEVLPGFTGSLGQPLGMGSKGLAIERQAPGQHAAHGFAVMQELFEHGLTFAFRRVRIGRTATATGQNKAQGGE